MKLLICTQAIDRDDPILGFFHGWVIEFSKQCSHIDIICLRKGTYDFPPHVRVHSLGKEEMSGRIKYVYRFFKYTLMLRREYDIVFSHMNPHYIILAGWLWLFLGKRMYFWRNHAKMDIKTWIAAQFATKVFYTSPYACTKRFRHSIKMPVGIDTELFKPDVSIERKRDTVLFFGRISPVKRPEIFIAATNELHGYVVHIYGDDPNPDGEYLRNIRTLASDQSIFCGAIHHFASPSIYATHEIYVNLTPEGSMDKTILEAAACGALIIVANKSFDGLIPDDCMLIDPTPSNLATKIRTLAGLPTETKKRYQEQLRSFVIEQHSLSLLAQRFLEQVTDV